MNLKTLAAALLAISIAGTVYGKENAGTRHSRTHTTFNADENDINNVHIVYLKNNNKVIIEMADVTDYEMIGNLDSLMGRMREDIRSFKDSLGELENVRFDYVLTKESDNTLIRFKKYSPDGHIFVKKNGELAHLKLEQDTLRLLMKKPLVERDSHMHLYDYPAQVTFVLNNYTDIDDLLKEKGMLNEFVATLAKATLPKKYDPKIKDHPTSIEYHPYSQYTKIVRNEVPAADESNAGCCEVKRLNRRP